jgi:MFS family permease
MSEPKAEALPRVVRALGWVSFFTDSASDLIYPLLPALLLSMGAGGGALGTIEGVSESIGAFVKWRAGALSDGAARRKPLVVAGYGLATFVRPLIALVSAPWQIVLIRTIDRVGKGIRSAPRDRIVAQAVHARDRAHAFGFHRMMDNAGAVVGALLAFVLTRVFELSIRVVIGLAIVPGLLALGTLLTRVSEPPKESASESVSVSASMPVSESGPVSALRAYLVLVLVFTLGASADSFLLLRLADLGLHEAWLPIVWLTLNASKSLTNVPGGRVADRIGRPRTLTIAWLVYAAAYFAFPLTRSIGLTWLLVVVYGAYYGLAEGAEKAMVVDLAPLAARGRALGLFHAITGIAVLPANAVFGALYGAKHEGLAFELSAGCAAVAAAGLALLSSRISAGKGA